MRSRPMDKVLLNCRPLKIDHLHCYMPLDCNAGTSADTFQRGHVTAHAHYNASSRHAYAQRRPFRACMPRKMEKDELLIDTFKNHPTLWDKNHWSFHDKAVRQSSWENVAKKCNFNTVEDCKARWKALREKLRREESAMERFVGGTRRAWYLLPKMEFLRDPLGNPSTEIMFDTEFHEIDIVKQEHDSDDSQSRHEMASSSTSRKRAHENETYTKIDSFCNYISCQLKGLPASDAESLMDEFILSVISAKKRLRTDE